MDDVDHVIRPQKRYIDRRKMLTAFVSLKHFNESETSADQEKQQSHALKKHVRIRLSVILIRSAVWIGGINFYHRFFPNVH